jgi:2-polyprenyl-3-methyl-5-hydroxy-6-metoxy-1,4-benzoquinol methylase
MQRFEKIKLIDAGLLSGFLTRARLRAARPYLVGTVLDFACGHGNLAQLCNPHCYVGYDLDERKLAVARRHFPHHRFQPALPEGQRFDVVVALAFIEHVNPEHYLKQFVDLLLPSGRIVLTTPHPSFEWVHTAGARLGLFSQEAHEDHEHLIDDAAITELAERLSLRVVNKKRFLLGANQRFVLARARTT